MNTQNATKPGTSWLVKIGWFFTCLCAFLFLMSVTIKCLQPEFMVKSFTQEHGYPLNTLLPIGIVESVCAILYLIPQTNILGSILLTGYMGGAIATHVRLNESFFPQAIIGMMVWLGPFLREPRLRQILFWRR